MARQGQRINIEEPTVEVDIMTGRPMVRSVGHAIKHDILAPSYGEIQQ